MSSTKIQSIVDSIKSCNLVEISELVKLVRDQFELPELSVGGVADGATAKEVEEQTEFSVVLKDVGSKKISVIKCLRQATNLGLREAKECVDGVAVEPYVIASDIAKSEAEAMVATFAESGATVVIQ